MCWIQDEHQICRQIYGVVWEENTFTVEGFKAEKIYTFNQIDFWQKSDMRLQTYIIIRPV